MMQKRVLYIEDDEAQIVLMSHFLERNVHNITVDFARSAAQGIALYDTEHYALVVIDYHLPDAQAPEIAERILKQGNPPPIIFISSVFSADGLDKAKALGIVQCLQKDDTKANLNCIEKIANQCNHYYQLT